METTTIFETNAPVAEEIILLSQDNVAEAETVAAVETTARDYWTPEGLKESAPIMGKGMLGIFIVMGIVIGCVSLLNNVSGPKKKKENKQ